MIFDDSVPVLLNTKQVAALLGIKPHTLEVARCEGTNDIPYHKFKRSVRYKKAEIEAYLESTQVGESLIGKDS